MKWYKSLSIDQKINAKECFELLCGMKFEQLSFLFSFAERIEIMHDKLVAEGFDV